MIIEYAGEVIRTSLTDVREKYYESKVHALLLFCTKEYFIARCSLIANQMKQCTRFSTVELIH